MKPKQNWPTSFSSEADAIKLVECLAAEGRTFHFDEDPEELIGVSFTQAELVTLARLESYCEQFRPAGMKGHGIWWLIERYPHIEKLLGLTP